MNRWLLLAFACAFLVSSCAKKAPKTPTTAPLPEVVAIQPVAPATIAEVCDVSLWQHVYHGRMATANDRLLVIEPCKTITGTIINAVPEKDGDWHIRVKVDPQFDSMLNEMNRLKQHGYLVVEPMCANMVRQADTIDEDVCAGFSQTLFSPAMKGKHVSITGAYVTDAEHGWNEIHPVSRISIIQ